jgi:hypothetical protein
MSEWVASCPLRGSSTPCGEGGCDGCVAVALRAETLACHFPRACVRVDGICALCPGILAPRQALQAIALTAPRFFPDDDPQKFFVVYNEWRSQLIHAAGGCNCLRT